LRLVLWISKLAILILAPFLKIKDLWPQFKNNVWFHVHITHHPRLEIV
jgi:hypothetical protein